METDNAEKVRGAQAKRIQMRLWVLLNMETPEKKPASSTAKRPRVTDSATTSLQTRRGWAQAFGASTKPPPPRAVLYSDHPAPSAHWMSCFSYSSGVNVRGRQAWMLLSWRAGRRGRK